MIIKRRVTRQFVQLDNSLVRDRRLSLDEHGMLHYLLSLPDSWEVNLKQIGTYWKIGRDKRRRIFRALRKTGWAQLERLQSEDGTFIGVRWIIGDEPGPETPDDVLSTEDDGDDEGSPTTETTTAPESESPDALGSANHATPNPAVGSTDGRVTRPPDNTAPSRIKTLEENRDSTNTKAGDDFDDDDGEPPPRFGELLRIWPADNIASAFACERVFLKLTDKHKRQARDGIKPYLDDCRHKGHNRLCDLRTYLDERRWQKFSERPAGMKLFVVKRGTAEAQRWREHLQKNVPEKLAVFEIAMSGSGGYTAPSQWPPPVDPGTGQAKEQKSVSLMSAEDEETDIPIK